MVLAGSGGVDHNKLCDLATKHFATIGTDYDHEIPLDQHCRLVSYYNFKSFKVFIDLIFEIKLFVLKSF